MGGHGPQLWRAPALPTGTLQRQFDWPTRRRQAVVAAPISVQARMGIAWVPLAHARALMWSALQCSERRGVFSRAHRYLLNWMRGALRAPGAEVRHFVGDEQDAAIFVSREATRAHTHSGGGQVCVFGCARRGGSSAQGRSECVPEQKFLARRLRPSIDRCPLRAAPPLPAASRNAALHAERGQEATSRCLSPKDAPATGFHLLRTALLCPQGRAPPPASTAAPRPATLAACHCSTGPPPTCAPPSTCPPPPRIPCRHAAPPTHGGTRPARTNSTPTSAARSKCLATGAIPSLCHSVGEAAPRRKMAPVHQAYRRRPTRFRLLPPCPRRPPQTAPLAAAGRQRPFPPTPGLPLPVAFRMPTMFCMRCMEESARPVRGFGAPFLSEHPKKSPKGPHPTHMSDFEEARRRAWVCRSSRGSL